jgi:hypothetical protein
MVAAGLRTEDILTQTGYSGTRFYTIRSDPAFQELVAMYKEKIDSAFVSAQDEFWETATSNMRRAERQIEEHLDRSDESDELLPLKTLLALVGDRADRFGYGKKSTQRNENLDFAAVMEEMARASGRSNVIDAKPIPPVPLVPGGDGGGDG